MSDSDGGRQSKAAQVARVVKQLARDIMSRASAPDYTIPSRDHFMLPS